MTFGYICDGKGKNKHVIRLKTQSPIAPNRLIIIVNLKMCSSLIKLLAKLVGKCMLVKIVHKEDPPVIGYSYGKHC